MCSWYLFDRLWKGERLKLTFEPPNGFEIRTPGLGIQHPNHEAIAPYKQRTIMENKSIIIFFKIC